MRFAWHKKQMGNTEAVNAGCLIPLVRLLYNAAWLTPIILTFTGEIDYTTGFVVFTAICIVRLIANLYANNTLTAEQYDTFLFRA